MVKQLKEALLSLIYAVNALVESVKVLVDLKIKTEQLIAGEAQFTLAHDDEEVTESAAIVEPPKSSNSLEDIYKAG